MFVMYKGCHKPLRMSSCFLSPTIQLSREVIQVNKVLLFSPFANPFPPLYGLNQGPADVSHSHLEGFLCFNDLSDEATPLLFSFSYSI